MKKTLLLLMVGAALLAARQKTRADDVSVDFFYDNLSGGNWIEVGDYGYCWQPDVAVNSPTWRPYADGYWAYTDLGWTWVSYEDFGWATYHYGRWARLNDYGWVWVPGRDSDLEWGPAWVSWRTGGEYVGWAPLPPETVGVVESRALTGHLDVEFNIGPSCYNFVDVRYIGEPVLRERIIEPTQNVTYIQQTVNVTNITYKNRTVYNYGPNIDVINRSSTRPIQRLHLDRQENVNVLAAAKSGGLTKVQGDKLVVAAPMRISRSTRQVAPQVVKAKVERANVDHGWAAVGDEKAQTEFKQKMKTQDLKNIPQQTAASARTNVNAEQNQNASVGAQGSDTSARGTFNQGNEAGDQSQTGGAHNRQNYVQPGGAEGPQNAGSSTSTSDQGQGQAGAGRGRHMEHQQGNTGGENAATNAQGGGRRGAERTEQGEKQQGQGQGQGQGRRSGKKGEASPAPSPQ